MKLIAKKPCSFGGKKFYIGDEIPVEIVLDPKAQEKMGVLVLVDAAQGHPAPETGDVETAAVTINIHAEEGDMPLDLTAEGLQSVVDILTGEAAEAEPIIKEMTDGDALILLHMIDKRKTVKSAAEARAKELNTEESAGEQ